MSKTKQYPKHTDVYLPHDNAVKSLQDGKLEYLWVKDKFGKLIKKIKIR